MEIITNHLTADMPTIITQERAIVLHMPTDRFRTEIRELSET